MGSDGRFLRPPQVAKRYGVEPAKVIRWIRCGELQAVDVLEYKGVGRPRFRIDPGDLVAFENKRADNAEPPKARKRLALFGPVTRYF